MSLVPIIQFEIDRHIAPVLEVVTESAALTDSLIVDASTSRHCFEVDRI